MMDKYPNVFTARRTIQQCLPQKVVTGIEPQVLTVVSHSLKRVLKKLNSFFHVTSPLYCVEKTSGIVSQIKYLYLSLCLRFSFCRTHTKVIHLFDVEIQLEMHICEGSS